MSILDIFRVSRVMQVVREKHTLI